jgi:hypothetical protein
MDKRSIVLSLVLDRLGITDISTVENRMAIQKAVYLAQANGLPLGYNYGWYVKGPYSPMLTRDYYALQGVDVPAGNSLNAGAVAKLDAVADIINEPIGDLGVPAKLELTASLRYLLHETRLSRQGAKERIMVQKPHLAQHVETGIALLEKHGLA